MSYDKPATGALTNEEKAAEEIIKTIKDLRAIIMERNGQIAQLRTMIANTYDEATKPESGATEEVSRLKR